MTFEPRKKLRIIVLVHEDLVPPETLEGMTDKDKLEVQTEFDVISTLKKMGHEVTSLLTCLRNFTVIRFTTNTSSAISN